MGSDHGADVQRILSRYKRLVLLGKAKIPLAEARRLVGPDTAFHLYFRHAETPRQEAAPARPRGTSSRARAACPHGQMRREMGPADAI